ncbi:hypothetical protein BGW39_008091 [Mortierella sp. 14UC]|nr:hypothetical protein BGW39_008091 [Mortierella sp. 14UC]
MAPFIVLFWTRVDIFLMALSSLIISSVCFARKFSREHTRLNFQELLRLMGHVGLFIGTILTVCQTPANQHPIEMRTIFHIFPLAWTLVLYILYIAKGGYFGFGDACVTNRALCVLDHFNTFFVLFLMAVMIGELASGWFVYFDYDFSNYFSDEDLPRRVQPQQQEQQEEQGTPTTVAAAAVQAKDDEEAAAPSEEKVAARPKEEAVGAQTEN